MQALAAMCSHVPDKGESRAEGGSALLWILHISKQQMPFLCLLRGYTIVES